MPLSVNTNVAAVRSLGALHATQASMATSLTRLSTGLRINSGKDDPTGLIAVTALSKELVEIDSHIDADQRAYFDSAITEGKLAQKSNMLLELKSLAVSSANAAGLSPDEKQANQLEVDSILSGLARLSGTSLQAPQQIDPQDFSHHISQSGQNLHRFRPRDRSIGSPRACLQMLDRAVWTILASRDQSQRQEK